MRNHLQENEMALPLRRNTAKRSRYIPPVHVQVKRIRTSQEEGDSKNDSASEWIKAVPLPEKIVALPHVLGIITTLVMTPEEALKEAMATRQLNWMEQIINRFDCDLTETMVEAAATNQQVVVELVLMNGFAIHTYNLRGTTATNDTKVVLEKAIRAGARNSHLDIVKLLLKIIITLWEHWFPVVRDVMDEAATNGHLNVVEFMVQHAFTHEYDTNYSVWHSVDTLSKAILGGKTDVAEFLINKSQILWNFLRAYITAFDRGQSSLAERIREVYPEHMYGSSLFLDLASWGHLEAVKYLYNNECDDSGLVGKAFAAAAGDGQRDVVKFLVGTGRVHSEAFDKAFKSACYGYQPIDTVTLLYNLKRVSQQGFNRGFQISGDVAVMKFLYEKEKISDKAITTAFTNSICLRNSGDSEIIQFLYTNPCISPTLIDEAFVNAMLRVKTDLVNSLKDDHRLSYEAMGEAFVRAVKWHNAGILKLLSDEHRTPGEALVQALMQFAHNKRIDLVKDIVKLLLARENTPRNFMHEAFVAAARHGQMSILEIVHQSQVAADLPLKVLKDALDVAGGNGNIESFIRKLVREQVLVERLQMS